MAAALSQNTRVAGSCFVLFCLSLFLASYSAKNPEVASLGKSIVSEVTSPVQQVSFGIHTGISSVWDGYLNLIGVQEENHRLQNRLQALETENSKLLEFESENKRLKSLL